MQPLDGVGIAVISAAVGAGLGACGTLKMSRRRLAAGGREKTADDGDGRRQQRLADSDRLCAIRDERIRIYARMSEYLRDHGSRLSKTASAAMVGHAVVDDAGPTISDCEAPRLWTSMIVLASDRTVEAWDEVHRADQELCEAIRALTDTRSEATGTSERMIPAIARTQSALDLYSVAERRMTASMRGDLDLQESRQSRSAPMVTRTGRPRHRPRSRVPG